MIKLEHTEVFGWESAIRGARNPMNSWDRSDSKFNFSDDPHTFWMGENDLKLMKNLSKAGSDHGKFLRMINVTVDITAPLYWWKEFDTYKVGTVANSCSTMHKIHAKEFTLNDFSCEHLISEEILVTVNDQYYHHRFIDCMCDTIDMLNTARGNFLETKDKKWWWQMIQLLPSSYNQKRTVQLNYQVLKSMYFARKGHRLDEWETLRQWIESLPYFKEIVIQE